jgi:predicted outer membrane protein
MNHRPALSSRPPVQRQRFAALLCACFLPLGAAAQPGPGPVKDASNATTHSRVSDGDRVFMRSAAGRLRHDRQLAELGQQRGRSRDVKEFAVDWAAHTDKFLGELETFAAQHHSELPKDMSDQAARRIRDLSDRRDASFDVALLRHAVESLEQEAKLFRDSARKMENKDVRDWANSAEREIRTLSSRAGSLVARLR